MWKFAQVELFGKFVFKEIFKFSAKFWIWFFNFLAPNFDFWFFQPVVNVAWNVVNAACEPSVCVSVCRCVSEIFSASKDFAAKQLYAI